MSRRISLIFLLCFFIISAGNALAADIIFTPDKSVQLQILREIDEAGNSISIALYRLSSREIAQALVSARNRGVNVRVLANGSKTVEKSHVYNYLLESKIPVRLYPSKGESMRHQFCIIDRRTIITGTNLWSSTSEKYLDTIIFFRNNPKVSQKFITEFDRLWKESERKK